MKSLTARQAQILKFIKDWQLKHGYPPTRLEIVDHFGFRSPNAAEAHLKALAKKGVIHLESGVSRGIRLPEAQGMWGHSANDTGLPLVGRVAAGEPILATEHIEDYAKLDPNLFKPKADYLLRVQGESMIEAGIHDHDLLAIHQTPEAKDNQIVVARLEDEVTVKRFYRKGHLVRLMPENPAFNVIEVDLRSQPFDIEGLVVGVIRTH